jgi:peptidoglycan/LPS O-acetylase OafA/YrhL
MTCFECVSDNLFVTQHRQLNMTAQPIVGFLLPTHSTTILGVLYVLVSFCVIAFNRILGRWNNARCIRWFLLYLLIGLLSIISTISLKGIEGINLL